jgi:hypothetical protein
MKMTRKAFKHPSGCWSKGFLWWGNGDKADKGDWVPKSLSEVHQDVIDFVNTLAPERVVSINEYTTMKKILGDDKVTHFVVWYWADDVDVPIGTIAT